MQSTEAKQLAWQGIEQNLPPKQTRRPLSLLLSLSFFYGGTAVIETLKYNMTANSIKGSD